MRTTATSWMAAQLRVMEAKDQLIAAIRAAHVAGAEPAFSAVSTPAVPDGFGFSPIFLASRKKRSMSCTSAGGLVMALVGYGVWLLRGRPREDR